MNAIYGYVMFSAILPKKKVFGHTFLPKAHRVMILVSRIMFLMSRNQMVPFISSCI